MPDHRLVLGKPDYTALDLPEAPDARPYVISNMVMSLDGTVTVEGTERGLGSPTDQALMRELRVNASVVMNGATTLRKSGTSSRVGTEDHEAARRARGLSTHPIAAVLTASADLPLEKLFFTARDFEAVVYAADTAPRDRLAAIEATGRRLVVLPAATLLTDMLAHMRHELDARVLLVEGGPHLLGSLVALGVVDEYFLTLGSVVVAGNTPLAATVAQRAPTIEGLTHFDLVSAHMEPEASEFFLRYRRRTT